VGMFPAEKDAPPIDFEAITPRHLLFDLIYNPDMTLFLREGAKRGAATRNGYEMLEIQAEESWKIWNS
jgi:shikimate dehydrogenase